MKIGVFSDVHGDLDALHATLALFERLQVDKIVCAGDLVDKGDQSDAVVALIAARGIPCVRGNHDTAWVAHGNPLDESTWLYLRRLPLHQTFLWGGVSVHLCHATPWGDASIYIRPDSPAVLFRFVIEGVSEQVIILGHTHHPMRVDFEGKTILNPGSVYANRNRPERTCGVLTLPAVQFDLYDIDTGTRIDG